jgi:hypothetical protein
MPTFLHPRGLSRSCAHVPRASPLASTWQRLKLSLSLSLSLGLSRRSTFSDGWPSWPCRYVHTCTPLAHVASMATHLVGTIAHPFRPFLDLKLLLHLNLYVFAFLHLLRSEQCWLLVLQVDLKLLLHLKCRVLLYHVLDYRLCFVHGYF